MHDISFSILDIADQSELLEEYGLIIPVIKRLDNNAKAQWPFDEKDILHLLLD